MKSDCKTIQKFQIGDFVKIHDGSKSEKSGATLDVEIVGHEYSLRILKGNIHTTIHSYNLKHNNGYIETNYPEHCIICKI